ncbi:MAG: trypsin-like peptidase domain-containing protein [Thermodesulfobacteriota bacterium]|jgi:S1-C subfamily serine protease
MKSFRIGLFSFLLCIVGIGLGISELKANPNCTDSISELFKRVSPSVVFISAVSIDPFKVINRVKTVIGSGFMISRDGLVLTNSHVVFGRHVIIVTLDDGNKAVAKVLGADPIFDLAVLQIPTPPEGHPAANLGDSDTVQIGEEVLAIGNPMGLEQTLTRGVVSGVNRILPESTMSMTLPLIQTDAAINLGNSGGPLVNRCGEVIGINSSILMDAQNVGFAVPINIAKQVIPQLMQQGRVIRPWVGIHGRLVKKEDLAILNIPLVDGFLVETVEPGSPAERVGVHGGELPITIVGTEFLLGGDIITEINGQSMDNPEKLIKLVRSLKVGDRLNLTLYLAMKTRKLEFDLPERPILMGDLPPDTPRDLMPGLKGGFKSSNKP